VCEHPSVGVGGGMLIFIVCCKGFDVHP
jgi:hypothetical protein